MQSFTTMQAGLGSTASYSDSTCHKLLHPTVGRQVPPEGSMSAKICLVGEAPGEMEAAQLRPFIGPAGAVLEQCLQAAGLFRHDCYITNVVKIRPAGNDISPFYKSGRFTPAGEEWVSFLYQELSQVSANIFVALGEVALSALTRMPKRRGGLITTYRGYILTAVPELGGRKVIPTFHPSATFWRGGAPSGPGVSPYILRFYIVRDLKRAKQESEYAEFRETKRSIVVPETAAQAVSHLSRLMQAERIAFDIEIHNHEISCIALSDSPTFALVLPFGLWSESEEAEVWRYLSAILEDERIVKVVQNAQFDIQFLASRCGILVRGKVEDPMIAHHIMYPDMHKSLRFLVSVYCPGQRYYKDMVEFQSPKEEG